MRDSVVALAERSDQIGRGLLKKVVAYLQKNSNAVAGFSGRVLSGAVLQLFYNAKSVLNHAVAFYSVDVDNRADAASVMLKT